MENPSKRVKNTNCPFSLVLKHRRIQEDYNTTLELEWTHNHPTMSLQSMSFNDIDQSTRDHIMELFEKGYSPSLAFKEMVRELRVEISNDLKFHIAMSNRSGMPRRSDFNLLFKTFNHKKYGTRDMNSIFSHLKGKC